MTALLMAIGVMVSEEEEEDIDQFINDPIILK